MKDTPKRRQKREIWFPAEYDEKDIRALQSLALYAKGADDPKYRHLVPGPEDTRRALDWIIHKAAQTYESSFTAADPNGRIGAYIEGRRSVGSQLIKLLSLKPDAFAEPED